MFRGRFAHNIDKKGRVSIPAKFREILKRDYGSDQLIMTIFDNCLVAYPLAEWQIFEEKMKDFSQFKKESKSFLRYFYSGAMESVIDDHGRILIPPQFREHADLNKEIVFVGMMNRFEIWNKDVLEKEFATYKESFDEISESIAERTGL
jgi:transcriptional regulator MraZ